MEIFMLIIVGLVAGVGVSLIFRSAGSMLSDIVVGVAGAFVGGFILRVTGLHTSCGELTGMIVFAFGGAVVLLGGLQMIRRVRSKV